MSQKVNPVRTQSCGSKKKPITHKSAKGGHRRKAFLKRTGVDSVPGEKANDFALKNQPFAMSAAMKTMRGGGELSISGWSS